MTFFKKFLRFSDLENSTEIRLEAMTFESEYRKIKANSEEIRKANAAWSKDFEKLNFLRQKGKQAEKHQDLSEAIRRYRSCLRHGTRSEHLTLPNYIHDINRLIVLYTKTKQQAKLKNLLIKLLADYPNCAHGGEWKIRLQKLPSKLKSNSV